MQSRVIAILGVGTDVGKSVATGLLAAHLRGRGESVITQKPVQTGSSGRPGDLLVHRRLMGGEWGPEDEEGLTCPYCFPFPASPHLAARLAGQDLDPVRISRATKTLADRYQRVLFEGVGGLLVPLTESLLLLDYVRERGYPVLLVTRPYLGAVNHTLLALEAIRNREMRLLGLVVNLHGDLQPEITRDFLAYFRPLVQGRLVVMPSLAESRAVNWQRFFEE